MNTAEETKSARIFAGVGSLFALLAFLAGIPTALVFLVGNPLPGSAPNWSNVTKALETGDIPGPVIANVVAVVVWAWWLQFAAAMTAEGLAVLRGTVARRILLTPGVQSVTAKLLATIVLSCAVLLAKEHVDPPDLKLAAVQDALPDGIPIGYVVSAGAGLSVVGGGLVLAIRRLRRLQRRRREPGEHVRRPPSQARESEQTLTAVADLQQLGFVGAALSVLDDALEGHDRPPIVGISHRPRCVTVLLEEQVAAPAPFVTVDNGFAWEVSMEIVGTSAPHELAGRAPQLLVTAGWHEKSGSEVLLNLEHIGHLGVGGAETDALPILTTMATELATSPLAENVEVVCVGFGARFTHLERLRVVPRLSDLLVELEAGLASGERPAHWVVIDPYTEDSEVLASLSRSVGQGVIAVTANGESQWKLACRPGTITVWPVDLTLKRRDLDAESIHNLEDVLDAAMSTSGEAADPGFEQAQRDVDLPEPDVEICVLGAVQVRGVAQEFSSRTALALVTYLAFHRDGATADQLKRWLWHPDSPPSDKLFANTISRARTTLGADSSGDLHLPRLGGDRVYRLADSVGTDVDRFRALIEAADDEPGASIQFLHEALDLVRGLVFAGGDDQPFAWVDHTIRSHVEFLVDETAHRLADEALSVGNSEEARWAALAGLRLIPDCESCFRRRFLAADLAGNRTELKRAMAELRRLVAVDSSLPDASDLISAELEELYADLLSGRPVAV